LSGTAIGSLALAAGASNDAAAWLILAIVVGSVSGDMGAAALAAFGMVAYVAVVVALIRPLLVRLARSCEEEGTVAPTVASVVLLLLMVGAVSTDAAGVHAVFGAFVLGAAVPRGLLSRELQRSIGPLTAVLLLPLFFVYSGLNTSIGLLHTGRLWAIASVVFLAACAGKGISCWLAARLNGSDNREAMAIGTLMNARGLMELVLLNIGLERGLIAPTLFTMLVIMAIGTTVMTYPLFGLVYGPVRAGDRPDGLTATSRT
jgi:Kef-type K+ transport system membrane component KefB